MPTPPVNRRPPHKSMGTDLTPLYLFVVLVGGGIAAAGWLFSRKQGIRATEARAATEASEVDPFAHIPDEVPSGLKRAAGEPRTTDDWPASTRKPPTGIEAEPAWIEAQELADKAWAHAGEAKKAAETGDKPRTLAEEREAARKAFTRALAITADWELDLVAKHGATDPVVRRIVRTRADWAEELELLQETKDR